MLAMNVPYLRRSPIMFLAAPLTATRVSPTLHFAQYTKVKKLKLSGNGTTESPPSPVCPELLARIAKNKQAALEKLSASNTPDEFGESWRKSLVSEFGKPYFINVRWVYPHIATSYRLSQMGIINFPSLLTVSVDVFR